MFNLSEVEDYWFFPQNICYVESLPLKEYDVFGICTLYIFYTHTHTHTVWAVKKKCLYISIYVACPKKAQPFLIEQE